MVAVQNETMPLTTTEDIVRVSKRVRVLASELGLSLVNQTKLATATSELARNTVTHGGGGTLCLEVLTQGLRKGLRLTFNDQGPGIADITMAVKDGYTTGSGMGLGLGGAQRLTDTFDIESTPGQGTRVSVTKWK